MHSLNIVHRDLKTENMLFAKNEKFVKLIDFGFANFCKQKKAKMHDAKGSPYYMSPEVWRGDYDKRCDLWSMGVVTFYLLAGKFPFMGKDEDDLTDKILSCDYDFDDEVW